jgi:hypothetical protein
MEAIVVLSNSLSQCLAQRLEALIISGGSSRDVWLLYDPSIKKEAVTFDQEIRGLHVAQQPDASYIRGHIHTLSGRRSHAATASFLLWLNRSVYSHAWYVESDVFYTGPWSDLFDAFPFAVGPDLVAHFNTNVGPGWSFWKDCALGGIPCNSIAPIQTLWFLLRMSRQLGAKMLLDFGEGLAKGHHEAITRSVCDSYNFSSMDFCDVGLPTDVNSGGYLYWKDNDHINMTLSSHIIQPRMLYHPIKCQADLDLGNKALMWIRTDISYDQKLRISKSVMPRSSTDSGSSSNSSTSSSK